MNYKRTHVNWFRIIVLALLVAFGYYFNRVIVPTIPPPFVPTPTATRAPESYVVEAQGLFDQGKLLQSIDMYKQAIQADPYSDIVYVAMARVQVFAGLYADAQDSAERAILLNADNSLAHAVLAWSLDFQGEILQAESEIKRALELDPNNGLAHAYYAEILVDSYLNGVGPFENLAKAAEESRVALALSPGTIEAHRARGYVLEATANYAEAIVEFEAAVAINGNIPDLHLALGRNYRNPEIADYAKAIEEFTRANSLNPSDPVPDLELSRTYVTVGEFAKAAQYAESAVKDAPTDASLRGNYGAILYYIPDWTEAARQLGLALLGGQSEDGQIIEPIPFTTQSRVPEYYYTYALALARLSRCGESIQIANLVLGRVPANEIAVANANEAIKICATQPSISATAQLAPTPTGTPTP